MNKSDFEIRALIEQVSQKELLDFYEVFKQATGYNMESPMLTEEYLKENRDQIIVTMKALLSAKLSKESIDKIISVFEKITKIEE